MKKLVYGSLIAAVVLFSGCGGGGGGGTTDTTAPVFNGTPANNTYAVAEGSTEVATIEVTDDSPVTFALGGDDAAAFELSAVQTRAIYSTTLKFKNAPDYETKSTYSVSVTATDEAGNSDTKEFTVNVTDVPFGFAASVPSTVSTVVGTAKTITLADNGEGNDTTTFNLVDNGGGAFTFDNNVTVTFNPGSAGTYIATVRATNGGVSVDKNITGTAIAGGSGTVDPGATVTIGSMVIQRYGYLDGNGTADGNGNPVEVNWNEAVAYCASLIGNWGLPTIAQLNDAITVDPNGKDEFTHDPAHSYGGWWSSEDDDNNASKAKFIYFENNTTTVYSTIKDATDSNHKGFVKCVQQ